MDKNFCPFLKSPMRILQKSRRLPCITYVVVYGVYITRIAEQCEL